MAMGRFQMKKQVSTNQAPTKKKKLKRGKKKRKK
jgi:hypothetical protein